MKHLVTIAALILGLAATGPGFAMPDLQEIKFNKSTGKTYDSILLRNVKLLDQENPGQEIDVNILIKSNQLELVSQDLIPLDEAVVTFDARGGFVLGQMSLGEPANFMVMDGNPRNDIDVLLDTKSHTLFAVRRGQVLRNRLEIVVDETPEEKRRASGGWLAYSPPPLAVPLDYQDRGKFNRFDTKAVSGLAAGAVVLDRQFWVDQNSASEAQVGDLTAFEGGEIRGLRVGAVGTLNFDKPWVWTLFGATHAFDKGFDVEESDEFTFFDVRLDIPVWEKAGFSIGKQKEPISMERLMSMVHLPMQERAAISDAILPSRNVGLVMSGSMFRDRVAWGAGAFNSWLDKDQPESFSDNTTNYVGRATWVPFESATESTLLHLGVAYRYSDAEQGAAVRTEPEFNQSPAFISSNLFDAQRIDTYQAEASLRSGPFWLHGEWLQADLESQAMLDPTVKGYHLTASWALSGEMREYNKRVGIFKRLPIARTVHQNGWGAWEVSTRYSTLDANDGLLEAGDMDIVSAGINWWLTPYFSIDINYRYITLDKDGLDGTSHGFNTRVLLVLE
jgi:phosphate-selective porin OprO and OprP